MRNCFESDIEIAACYSLKAEMNHHRITSLKQRRTNNLLGNVVVSSSFHLQQDGLWRRQCDTTWTRNYR